jgi:hypothetical protein
LLGPEVQTIVQPPTAQGTSLLFVSGLITMRYYW